MAFLSPDHSVSATMRSMQLKINLKKLRGVIAASKTAANSFNSKMGKFVCRFYMPSSTEASAK